MKALWLVALALCVAVPVDAQCSGLGCAVESNERAINTLDRRLDLFIDTTRVRYDSLLVLYSMSLQHAVDTVVVEQPGGDSPWPLILGIAGAALGTAALVAVLTHHHHSDVESNMPGDSYVRVVVTRPAWCWPPGHCK
jgi:hypothetical protein